MIKSDVPTGDERKWELSNSPSTPHGQGLLYLLMAMAYTSCSLSLSSALLSTQKPESNEFHTLIDPLTSQKKGSVYCRGLSPVNVNAFAMSLKCRCDIQPSHCCGWVGDNLLGTSLFQKSQTWWFREWFVMDNHIPIYLINSPTLSLMSKFVFVFGRITSIM